RGMREWTEVGFSSIYYLLKKLEQAGLIESRLEEAARGPARKVYRMTGVGWDAFRQGILDSLGTASSGHAPLLLSIGSLPVVSKSEAVTALQHYRETLEARLAHIRARQEAQQQPLPYYVDALFDYSVVMIQAERDWIAEFIKQVEAQDEQS
ncbi:MAG: PadR family transcriptional regulator, partial [Anaerolineae bacterium]|nr:PadR family transcriptional regulator [Anaerolineae bacterium]